jgi:hypothetical protein
MSKQVFFMVRVEVDTDDETDATDTAIGIIDEIMKDLPPNVECKYYFTEDADPV